MTTFWSDRRTTGKDRQDKKHFTQMTLQEKETCVKLLQETIKTYNKLTVSPHFKRKEKVRTNLNKLMGYVLSNKRAVENIIEYNVTEYHGEEQRRVILRHPQTVEVEGTLSYQYLVVSLEDGTAITTYYNGVEDNHKTLDLSYYNKDLTIK